MPLGDNALTGCVQPSVRLTKHEHGWRFVCWRPGKLKGSWLASQIPGWLAWQLQHGPTPLHVLTMEKENVAHSVHAACDDPGSWLRELVETFRSGSIVPQPFFPDAGLVYLKALEAGKDIDAVRASTMNRLTGDFGEMTKAETAMAFRHWSAEELIGVQFHKFASTAFAPLLKSAGEGS